MTGITTLRLRCVRGFAGLALVPLLAVFAYSQNTQPEQPRNEQSGWVLVKDWSGGAATIKTETFAVPSDTWRVTYTTTFSQRFGFLDIIVRDSNGQKVTAAYGLQLNDPA